MSLELTYQDVAEHNTKKDIYLVIHDKIYDASKFIDEHPYVSAMLSSKDGATFSLPAWPQPRRVASQLELWNYRTVSLSNHRTMLT